MVSVEFHPSFKKTFSKLRDIILKDKIIKQLTKIRQNPEIGKPMKFWRKGTREVYIPPFRLSYEYIKEKDKVVILDLYHKDDQVK